MARSLNEYGPNRPTGPTWSRTIRISSPNSPHDAAGAARRRPREPRATGGSLTGVVTGLTPALVLFLTAPAQSQEIVVAENSAAAPVEAQIKRLGCNLPQYANAVEGCRRLNAKAKAMRLAAGPTSRRSVPYSNRRRPRSRAQSSERRQPARARGGLFNFLFGAPDPNLYRRRDPYGRSRDYYYSPSPSGYGTYRTLCVRLCDGYYWPISYTTVRGRLNADAQHCQSSCGSDAKLFFHANPGGSVDTMVDLEGKPYANLPNAFRYREEYDSNCRCKPEPWSEAAKAEYERRAEAEAATDQAGDSEQLETAEKADAPPEVQSLSREQRPSARSRRGNRPARRAERPGQQRERIRFWETILPFGRWSSGG